MKRISEDWDGDLLKLIPQAEEIIARVADVKLFTRGSVDKEGRLSHPSVWNQYAGMVAFFDFEGELESKPDMFWTDSPIVRCTALDAFADAWGHHYVLLLRGEPVWDTFKLQDTMMRLLYTARGVTKIGLDEEAKLKAQNEVADSLRGAVRRVEHLNELHNF
jgi:hypothetical protein